MTHHDSHWGILGSQLGEDQSREQAIKDPAEYHASIAARELHWFDAVGVQWVARDASGDWQGWDSATAENAAAPRTGPLGPPPSIAQRRPLPLVCGWSNQRLL